MTLDREYDPWGVLLSGASFSGYGFTGREWDAELELLYVRARYLNPLSARFLSDDPLGIGGSTNLSTYVGGSPIRFTDLNGLSRNEAQPNAAAQCLVQVFGQPIGSVKIETKGANSKWAATTRENKIILYGTEEEFFAPGNEETVLEEYYHVLDQWNTGEVSRVKYIWENIRHGYDGNKYEKEAQQWARDHVGEYTSCLKR